jgi:GNAT superfamily N-acetyltransferase
MIEFRSFLNSDPPAIAEIWRSQLPTPALIQPMTPAVLDDIVFSKPFFDRNGLILAIEDDRPIGFVHAGFAPSADLATIDSTKGTTAMLLVSPHDNRDCIAEELLARSEQYLRDRGATTLFGGATKTLAPLYFGLYGGSQLPGVMASDSATAELFRRAGYGETMHVRLFRRDLSGFRPPVDRALMKIRRQFTLVKQTESLPESWWEACGFAAIERLDFVLLPKMSGPSVARALLWDIEPAASSWGVRASGLVSMNVDTDADERAVTTHFVSEIFRQLQGMGITLVEFQLDVNDTLRIEVCHQIGFQEVDQGLLFQKPAIS